MRLWSLHPQHLDPRGIVALWREGLLARAVLRGQTRGYRQHPQLQRFAACEDPPAALDCYLSRVLDEAVARGYHFDASKISYHRCPLGHAEVTAGQLSHEWQHLLDKLMERCPPRWLAERGRTPQATACFRVIAGPVAPWEKGPPAAPSEAQGALPGAVSTPRTDT